MITSEHVPDRLGEPAGDVDLGDFRAALAAKAGFGALVALAVDRVPPGVGGGLDQRPAQVLRPRVGERAAAVSASGLIDAGAQAGVAGEL